MVTATDTRYNRHTHECCWLNVRATHKTWAGSTEWGKEKGVERERGRGLGMRGQHMLAGLCIMSSLVTKSMSPLHIPHSPLSLSRSPSRLFMDPRRRQGESHLRPQPAWGTQLSYACNKVTVTTATTHNSVVGQRGKDGERGRGGGRQVKGQASNSTAKLCWGQKPHADIKIKIKATGKGRGCGKWAFGHLKSSLKRPLKGRQKKGCGGRGRAGGAHTHIMRLSKRGNKQAKTTRATSVSVCLCVAAVSTQLPLFPSPFLPLSPICATVTGQPGQGT